MTEILYEDSFMTLSKGVISAHGRQMFTACPRFQEILLINVWPKVFLLPEITGDVRQQVFWAGPSFQNFLCPGQTGQQLLLGGYGALMRQVKAGTVELFNHHEMLNLVVAQGRVQGIVTRDLIQGRIQSF